MSDASISSSQNISAASKNITAVILAGGASSRMGSDKALLEWRGRPFVAHIVEHLREHVADIAINSNDAANFAQFGRPVITDATAQRRGPLAGILAALNFSTTELTLVVPCDNPMTSPQLIARLHTALTRDHSDLAYASIDDDNHYLYALMRTHLRDRLTAFMQGDDYAVRHWYATLRVSRVDFSDQSECFRNINSADELAQLPI